MKRKFNPRGPRPVPIETVFWDHVKKGAPDECWLWEGASTKFGYGDMKSHQKRYNAHRVSYELHKGPIPKGMFVCHSCDIPRCCNPDHLWLGTHQDNMVDAVSKGRNVSVGLRGALNGRARLSEQQVQAIRRDPRPGTHIAADIGLSVTAINQIRSGKSWKHLPMPNDGPQIRVGRPSNRKSDQ